MAVIEVGKKNDGGKSTVSVDVELSQEEEKKVVEDISEHFVTLELAKMSVKEQSELINEEVINVLKENYPISKQSIIHLSKNNKKDKIAACEMAKVKNDPLWRALVDLKEQQRTLLESIMFRYAGSSKSVLERAEALTTKKLTNIKKIKR